MIKPIVKICYKLLYVILGVKSIFDEVTSWPQLISKLLVASACLHAASDWPHTFLHPKCFLFSYNNTSCFLEAIVFPISEYYCLMVNTSIIHIAIMQLRLKLEKMITI